MNTHQQVDESSMLQADSVAKSDSKETVARVVYDRTKEQRDFWMELAETRAKIIDRLTAENDRLRAAITVAARAVNS